VGGAAGPVRDPSRGRLGAEFADGDRDAGDNRSAGLRRRIGGLRRPQGHGRSCGVRDAVQAQIRPSTSVLESPVTPGRRTLPPRQEIGPSRSAATAASLAGQKGEDSTLSDLRAPIRQGSTPGDLKQPDRLGNPFQTASAQVIEFEIGFEDSSNNIRDCHRTSSSFLTDTSSRLNGYSEKIVAVLYRLSGVDADPHLHLFYVGTIEGIEVSLNGAGTFDG